MQHDIGSRQVSSLHITLMKVNSKRRYLNLSMSYSKLTLESIKRDRVTDALINMGPDKQHPTPTNAGDCQHRN